MQMEVKQQFCRLMGKEFVLYVLTYRNRCCFSAIPISDSLCGMQRMQSYHRLHPSPQRLQQPFGQRINVRETLFENWIKGIHIPHRIKAINTVAVSGRLGKQCLKQLISIRLILLMQSNTHTDQWLATQPSLLARELRPGKRRYKSTSNSHSM